MITAVILAAGQGSRLQGQPKALLRFQGRSFLEQAQHELAQTDVSEILVVTGAYRERVAAAILSGQPPRLEAFNPDFATGLLSSIQCAIRRTAQASEALLITLVDLPFLTATDYQQVLKAFTEGKKDSLVRAYASGKPGHPVIIPRPYFAEILQEPAHDKGCSFLFQRYPDKLCPVMLANRHGRIDIDTIEDYHAHITP